MLDAVRSLDVQALDATDPAHLVLYLPVLVWGVDRQPALRPLLDRVPTQANFVLRLHDLIGMALPASGDRPAPTTSFDFSRLPLPDRISTIVDAIRRQRTDPILSDVAFQDEIGSVVAVTVLRSIPIAPLPELLTTLLLQKNGVELGIRILINCPDQLAAAINIVIRLSVERADLSAAAESLLTRIANLSPSTAQSIRDLLLAHQAAPSLILRITIEFVRDELQFLSSVLLDRDTAAVRFLAALKCSPPAPTVVATRGHMPSQRAASASNSPLARLLFERFRERLRSWLVPVGDRPDHDAVSAAQRAALTIQVACQLQALVQIVLPFDLAVTVLDVMTCPTLLATSNDLSDYCLCFLFQCSALFKAASADRIIDALRSVKSSSLFKRLALGCLNGDRSVGLLLSETLGVPMRPLAGHVDKLFDLMASGLSLKFADVMLRTPNDLATLRCVLESSLFLKQIINDAALRARLRDDLSKLLVDPVYDSTWIAILQRTAEFCISATTAQSNQGLGAPVQPFFSEIHISHLIANSMKPCPALTEKSLPVSIVEHYTSPCTVVLLVYYVLHYNRVAYKKSGDDAVVFHYSNTILDSVPIFALLEYLQRSKSPFAVLRPQLQDILLEERAELFNIDHELCRLIDDQMDVIAKFTAESHPVSTDYLEYLLSMPAFESVAQSSSVLQSLPSLLETEENQHGYHFQCFLQLWNRWCREFGQISFYFDTLAYFTSHPVSPQYLTNDPVQALSVHDRIWMSPTLSEMFLSVLFVIFIRYGRLSIQSNVADSVRFQCCSAVIFKLIEKSHSFHNEKVVSVIFKFVDEAFRRSPDLLQHCLFKGFPLHSLSKLVAGLPSLESAIEYLPRLLAREYEDEQVFAVNLLSELSQIYQSQTKSVSASVFKRFADETVDSISAYISILRKSLPAIIQIARCHPSVAADVIRLLSILRPTQGFERSEVDLGDEVDRAFLAVVRDLKPR